MPRISQRHRLFLAACLSSALIGLAARAALPQAMTADDIVGKNIAARGGLQAWRNVQTMTMTGKIDAGSKQNVQLPFVMKLKRPRMSRFELEFAGKTALQVYDGATGWKMRPFLGRAAVEPFTQAELDSSAEQQDLDGFLIDHAAKGIRVEFVGIEPVEGRNAYRLKLTLKGGQARNLWVDTQSFLEVKTEGAPRRLNGKLRKVEVYYRDYRQVDGLMLPFTLETVVDSAKPGHKINIEKIVLNPKLDETAFAKPEISGMRASN